MISYKLPKDIRRRTRPWDKFSNPLILAGIVLMFLSLSGCGQGLPDDIKKNAKAIPDAIEAARKEIQKDQKQFASLKKSAAFAPIATYAQKEAWDTLFAEANNSLDRAGDLHKQELVPLLKKNTPESAPQVLVQTKRINQVIQEARQQAKGPVNRFSRIREALDNTDAVQTTAQAIAQRIIAQVSDLEKDAVTKAREAFPDTIEKIDTRFSPFLKMQQAAKEHLYAATREYEAHKSKAGPDYAAFIDNADALTRNDKTLEQTLPVFKQDLAQLYESYTKVLQDMKEDYFVTIKRESWDENSDYYDPKFATFQRQVSPSAYEILTDTEMEAIATLSPGFSGLRFSSGIGDTWKQLGINPTEQWPARYHNAASFEVEDSKEVYYHKYLKEENGETSETDWIQVDPSFYEQNLEFLGMAILSKPYGVFEQDRITQATPPGLAYMGNPEYGEWKKDDTGNSFWSWYGKYALFSHLFFFPPSYFHRGAWGSWNNTYRNQQPYFGKTQTGNQQYGTRGSFVNQSPKYQSSNFSKTGGFKSQSASVRGAGAGLRGGGPKAKGK